MVPEPPVQAQAPGQGEGHDGQRELSQEGGCTRPSQGKDDPPGRWAVPDLVKVRTTPGGWAVPVLIKVKTDDLSSGW